MGEASTDRVDKAPIDEWLHTLDMELSPQGAFRRAATFSVLSEKTPTTVAAQAEPHVTKRITGGRGSVRTMPFSIQTLRRIAERFGTHGSIAKTISRADVPLCSCESVEMGEPAYGMISGLMQRRVKLTSLSVQLSLLECLGS